MKYYGVIRKRHIEKTMYRLVKLKSYFSQFILLDKKKRDVQKFIYSKNFVKPYQRNDKNYAIPEGKYCKPICIITSDLVLRENIPQLKTGLINLIKKQYTHKFLGFEQSMDEILKNIENMDNVLSSWYDKINVGRFDFKKDSKLNNVISYFDVYIKNINSSYLSVEFHLYLGVDFDKELTKIINSNYIDKKGYVWIGLTQNHKSSGAKNTYGICFYNNANLKSDLINESISMLKWRFYNKIQKYCSTILHQKGVIPPSINIYKTNIHYSEKPAYYFWQSLGISSYQGQFINESRKLFFIINLSARYKANSRTDLIYVVNELTIESELGYHSVEYQIIDELEENLCTNIFKFAFLDALNELVVNYLIPYKQKLNKVKLKKNRLNKLLKLRYKYEKDIDFYRRYVCDDIWEKAKNIIAQVFDEKTFEKYYDYRLLTDSPVATKNKIIEQIEAVCTVFNEKTSILQHLAAYKNENRNKRINIFMLLLTAATLVFIVFPDLSKEVSIFLLSIFNYMKDVFK